MCHFEVLQYLAHLLFHWGLFVQESQVSYKKYLLALWLLKLQWGTWEKFNFSRLGPNQFLFNLVLMLDR